MDRDNYAAKASDYLNTLCSVKPNRRTGSAGNWAATEFFADTIRPFGYEIDTTPFDVPDHIDEGSSLTAGDKSFEVFTSPYSLGCEMTAELVMVDTVKALESAECRGKILLMRGPICAEQLMPKNFVFYNPEHHQKIIALLESKKPAAVITATERSPDQVGALYPFPLLLDGDFDIPSMYCRDDVGDELAKNQGRPAHMRINARRLPSKATNVVATLNRAAEKKVVLTAHIDAYEGTPGASDNASGTAVLLLAAEMLADYRGEYALEIAAFNGEDHYSVGGQMDYLRRYGEQLGAIHLAVNIDDVGYRKGRAAYSFYECPDQLQKAAEGTFSEFDGLCPGEPWFNGDHMIFVQNGVPCMAMTAEYMPELMRTVTHTALDTPDLVDSAKLVEVAASLNALVKSV
ncbi:MAG TPA: M28 family peptidase [Anaerolineae bacterium]|jgi:aminopeptidase YwaD|nr:M28 family peptidase [Anaerolineae bacterium]